MAKDVIIACDFPDRAQTLAFLETLGGRRPFLKIGMELFYATGPEIVRELKTRGHRIFLDLKLHDIPNTAQRAMSVLSGLGADIVNVHAAGTRAMMEAALHGAVRPDGTRPRVIAVTQLTSTGEKQMQNELLIGASLADAVLSYARNAKAAGLDGVVCSALEAAAVHDACGGDFLTVTPGVRFADAQKDDQTRIATPARAAALGADYIVVGRPVTRAEDPAAAYDRCIREFLEARA